MNNKLLTDFSIFLEPIKDYNIFLDILFYDVGKLTNNERTRLKEEITPEGSIIVVPPSSLKKEYKTYEVSDFIKSSHKSISKFVISGVGSSDIGTFALARNVADFYNEEVGAIIAGYGIYDLITESLGGFFSLGLTNRCASIIEKTSEILDDEDGTTLDTDIHPYITGNPDSKTLLTLLMSNEININLLLGHSKGCLSIANSLNGFVENAPKDLLENRLNNIKIITTGAIVEMPDFFLNHYYQYIGSIDWFGGINSSFLMEFELVPFAWHHTNTMLPFSLDITKLLSNIDKYKPVSIFL